MDRQKKGPTAPAPQNRKRRLLYFITELEKAQKPNDLKRMAHCQFQMDKFATPQEIRTLSATKR